MLKARTEMLQCMNNSFFSSDAISDLTCQKQIHIFCQFLAELPSHTSS